LTAKATAGPPPAAKGDNQIQKQHQRQEQKQLQPQIPSLRCGMTNKEQATP
jgi:hypothetical protein